MIKNRRCYSSSICTDDIIVIVDTYEECLIGLLLLLKLLSYTPRKKLLTTSTRNDLPRIYFQFKGNDVGYIYQ